MSEPRKGIHSIRLFDIAVVDVLLTIVAAIFIQRWSGIEFWKVLLGLFIFGIIVHRILGIRTKVHTLLFDHVQEPEASGYL